MYLQNPTSTTADSDTSVNHTITRDGGTAMFGVWSTLSVQVFVALFILCVDYAGTEPRENNCKKKFDGGQGSPVLHSGRRNKKRTGCGFVEAFKETVAPFPAVCVHGQVLRVTVSATDGHTRGSLRLLRMYFLVVLKKK